MKISNCCCPGMLPQCAEQIKEPLKKAALRVRRGERGCEGQLKRQLFLWDIVDLRLFLRGLPKKGRKDPLSCLAEPSPSNSQCIKVRTDKQSIQSIFVLLQAPISNLPVPKLAFDDSEYVLHFASDRGFLLFNITCPVDGVVAYSGESAGTQVDAVVNGG